MRQKLYFRVTTEFSIAENRLNKFTINWETDLISMTLSCSVSVSSGKSALGSYLQCNVTKLAKKKIMPNKDSFISDVSKIPFNEPYKNFCNQRKIRLTKVL